MRQVVMSMDEGFYWFYRMIGKNTGRKPEQVMQEVLIRLAGEMAQSLLVQRQKEQL